MVKISELDTRQQFWIVEQLLRCGLSLGIVDLVMTSPFWRVSVDEKEIRAIIKERKGLEFESTKDLLDYIFSPQNADVFVLCDKNGANIVCMVWMGTPYKDADAVKQAVSKIANPTGLF